MGINPGSCPGVVRIVTETRQQEMIMRKEQKEVVEAIKKFKISNGNTQDYVKLFIAASKSLRQGISLTWQELEESINEGIKTSQTDVKKEEELHPVRFSHRHVDIIKHIMGHFSEYFEQESEEVFEHLRKSEEGMDTELKELSQ